MSTAIQRLKGRVKQSGAYRQLEFARWRARNLDRIVRHRAARSRRRSDPDLRAIVDELRAQGIVSRPWAGFSLADPGVIPSVMADASQRWAEAQARMRDPQPQGSSANPYVGKEYKVRLVPDELSVNSPFVRLALDPRLIEIAARYLGMQPALLSIELWWDRPTTLPAKETQLWHRDGDDLINVKVFLYLNDVDEQNGPFCFIPATHPFGRRRAVAVERNEQGRSTDEQMVRAIPASEWCVCTAAAGTMILCDTCGYHKGLKPSHHERLLLMFQYASGAPRYPRLLKLMGTPDPNLSPVQRRVLGEVHES